MYNNNENDQICGVHLLGDTIDADALADLDDWADDAIEICLTD